MPKVLIAGCGYVGTATAKLLLERGWDVTGWTRSGEADRKIAKRIEIRAVDMRHPEQVRRNSIDCDVVIHCASSSGGNPHHYRRLYGDGIRNLATAFPQARLIFTSSTSVYPQRDGAWVDEDSPTRPAAPKPRILLGAEEFVLGQAGIVLRLGAIYGPGRSALLQGVRNGKAAITAADRYVNHVHRDDAASAIVFAAEQKELRCPRLFNVVDDKPTMRNEVLRWLAIQLHRQLPISSQLPISERGPTHKRVSNARLRALGWKLRYPNYREGFLNSVLSAGSEF
jgi:nucleoside-diphosphate-sugar epimerase